MRVVRCPSKSAIKLDAIRQAFAVVDPSLAIKVEGSPVELQDRPDMSINAQPVGKGQTIEYARARWREMCQQHGPTTDLDIVIESGAIYGFDVAVVIIHAANGNEIVVLSEGIKFPDDTLEEALKRGAKTTTAGDIIHERCSHIPANNWHEYFIPYVSRRQQIQSAIERGLRQITH